MKLELHGAHAHAPADFTWKVGAPAGFGVMTIGLLMAKLAARCGRRVATYAEYPSLIQGGHNTYELTFTADTAEHPHTTTRLVDCLVCLTADTFELHRDRLHPSSLVVYDPLVFAPQARPKECLLVPLPLTELQGQLKADKIMINTIALGASAALLGAPLTVLSQLITDQFQGRKSEAVAAINLACAEAGYTYITEHFTNMSVSVLREVLPDMDQAVLTGNEAFSLGAVAADCRFYASYPMTPTSAVLEILAQWQNETGMIVRQSEDEIAVISQALGAGFAGARSAVGTSGGGFALMVESVSYAGIAEIPVVILMGQRPGPATGMPTWTEQGDLSFVVHAGHGEFPKIVLAPGDVTEMIELTAKAFDLADIYQLPVILLTDKFLQESHASIPAAVINQLRSVKPNRGKLISISPTQFSIPSPLAPQPVSAHSDPATTSYLRYELTDDGISPRVIPGTPGTYYQANSYEHIPNSHTTEDSQARIDQVDKRARKISTYLNTDWRAPAVYGSLQSAKAVLVTWGSQKEPCLAAARRLSYEGTEIALIHFTHLFPLDAASVRTVFSSLKQPVLLVENNATGQLNLLLSEYVGVSLEHTLLKYDGRPVYAEEVVTAIKQLITTGQQPDPSSQL